MPVIGITGGIATGKSSFCAILKKHGAGTFFDADEASHEISQADPEARARIVAEFGPDAYLANGDLNRALIRSMVFADAEKKRALEQILHPRIRRQWSLEADRRRHSTQPLFADIPLLYETDGETLCDRVVVVACSAKLQLARLRQRMSIDEVQATAMIAAQMPLAEKIRRADHLVWNNGSLEVLAAQARALSVSWEN